jgi:hypothetical protein
MAEQDLGVDSVMNHNDLEILRDYFGILGRIPGASVR